MFDPAAIEIATDGQRSLLKARAVVQWEEARRRYTELSGQIEGNEEGALNQVFSKAYDAAGAQLCGALLTHLPHDQPLDCPFISLPNLEDRKSTRLNSSH